MINEFRAIGLHQRTKDIMKKDMTIKEVQELLNWHCDDRNDDKMILEQLVTAKYLGKVK